MPEPQTNGSVNHMIHEEAEVAFRAHERVQEEKAHDEQIQKIHKELDALKADDKEIQKIHKELDDLRKQQTKTATEFEIQKAKAAFWNNIQAILVPILSAAVFGLASWVWQSEGKIVNAEMRVTTLQEKIEAVEGRMAGGAADRYTRTTAEDAHKVLEQFVLREVGRNHP